MDSNRKEENNNGPPMTVEQVYIAYPQLPGDQIRLVEIWQGLVAHRKILAIVFLFCILISGALAVTLPSMYRVDVVVRPPALQDIEAFRVLDFSNQETGITYIHEVDAASVYYEFLSNLRSSELQLDFFTKNVVLNKSKYGQNGMGLGLDSLVNKFQEKLVINDLTYKRDILAPVEIGLTGGDPDYIVDILNEYINFVNRHTVAVMKDVVVKRVNHFSNRIEEQIAVLRLAASNKRNDQIERYQEARIIAEKLDIKDSVIFSESYNQEIGIKERENLVINTFQVPLYLRGTKTIDIEIEALKNRKNDDPFIPELRDLQGILDYYKNIQIRTEDISSVKIDSLAVPPDKPYKPNRVILLVMGGFIGMIVSFLTGVFLCLAKWKSGSSYGVKTMNVS